MFEPGKIDMKLIFECLGRAEHGGEFDLELLDAVAGGVVAAGERAGAHGGGGGHAQQELPEQRGAQGSLNMMPVGDFSKECSR